MKHLNIIIISLFLLNLVGSVNAANEDINPDKNLLNELGKHYHDEFGTEWIIVTLDNSKLKYGDYIQMEGFDYVFMYLYRDTEGLIYLSSDYGRCNIKKDDFNRVYTGYALLINY